MNIGHINEPFGLDALLHIERLPVLRDARSYMISSCNRDYWNDDNIPVYLRRDEGAG